MQELLRILAEWTPPAGATIEHLQIERDGDALVFRLVVDFPRFGRAESGRCRYTDRFLQQAAHASRFIQADLTEGFG